MRLGRILAIPLFLLLCASAHATVINSASCSAADVTAAIATAVTGDTVQVLGPCSPTWATFVTIPNTKGITVIATGGTVALSNTSEGFILNAGANTTRISGFTCNRNGNVPIDSDGHCVQIVTAPGNATYRIDHWSFCGGGGPCTTPQTIFVTISGIGPGLWDHNTMSGNGSSFIQENGTGSNQTNTSGWTSNVVPGGSDMLFFEDNVFSNSVCVSACGETSNGWIQGVGGTKTVIRHNTFNMIQIDQHGSQGGGAECSGGGSACTGNVGVRWYEIYNNQFVLCSGCAWFSYMDLRAGSGVIFNNTIVGSNASWGFVRLFEENTLPWPQAYQIGSGLNDITSPHASCVGGTQNTTPVYLWAGTGSAINTGADSPIAFNLKLDNGTASTVGNVQLNRDLFISSTQPATLRKIETSGDTCATTYTYTPYIYPHPLATGGGPPPPPTIAFSPNPVTFANQAIGTSSAQLTLTVTNNGGSNETLGSTYWTITGANAGDFNNAMAGTCGNFGVIAPGGSCTVKLTFTPSAGGTRTASFNLVGTTNASVSLTGLGLAPGVSLNPINIAFGNQNTGTSSPNHAVTLTNNGLAILHITSILLTGANAAEFSQNSSTCGPTLAISASCTLNVVFSPLTAAAKTANLTFTTDAGTSPDQLPLTGTGQTPITVTITILPSPVVFGNQVQNTTSLAQTVTVTSTGTGNEVLNTPFFTITGTNAADFANSGGTCSNGQTLAPTNTCTVLVTCTPSLLSAETANLNISGTVSGTVQMTCSGIAAPTTPAPAPVIFVNANFPQIGYVALAGSCPMNNRCTYLMSCSACSASTLLFIDNAQVKQNFVSGIMSFVANLSAGTHSYFAVNP